MSSEVARQYVPYLVAFNLSDRCNLSCAHCYMDAAQKATAGDGELRFSELAALFADIGREAPGTIAVLTGGEPLMRPDIEGLVDAGRDAGLRMVIGTNGVLLTKTKIRRFKELGLEGVGISLDSVSAEGHDSFRGVTGSFARACTAIRQCKAEGLHAQVHFTVTKHNCGELAQAVALARDLGAAIINFFFLVCIGRGGRQMDLSADLYEQLLEEIAGLQRSTKGIMVQSRCTPHYKRILYENDPASPYTRATGYDGGGCPAASHYCRITPNGDVTPCPYIELSAGNVRQKPFWDIWDEAVLFESLRTPDLLQGRCARCEYKLLCGGCRARSLAQAGNLMGEDPNCSYVPQGGETIPIQIAGIDDEVEWTPEARERLARIPVFLRPRIKKKLEERARAEGTVVTPDLMQRHREERELELGIKFN